MKKKSVLIAIMVLLSATVQADWKSTGYVDLDIRMDNGKIYFYGFTTTGTCQHDRLELDEAGDYWGKFETNDVVNTIFKDVRKKGFTRLQRSRWPGV